MLAAALLTDAAEALRPVVWQWNKDVWSVAVEASAARLASIDTLTAITHSSAAAALVVDEDLRDVLGPGPVNGLVQRFVQRPSFARLAPPIEVTAIDGSRRTCSAGDGAYWDHCGVTGATYHACRTTDDPFCIVVFTGGEPYRWRRYIGDDHAPDLINCPHLFELVGEIARNDRGECFSIRLSVSTIPNSFGIPPGRELELLILGNRELEKVGVMPVRRHVEHRRFAQRIRATLNFFRNERRALGGRATVCACAGGGVRSMISGLCGLHAFRDARVLAVSGTSGGGWAIAVHYLTDKLTATRDRSAAIADLCREFKDNLDHQSRCSFFPLHEIVRDIEECRFDWSRVVGRMFRSCEFRPPSADAPALLLHSCVVGDCVEDPLEFLSLP